VPELIARHRVTIILAAPTFLRGYLPKRNAAIEERYAYTITGAEKMPSSLAEAFEQSLRQTGLSRLWPYRDFAGRKCEPS
jgi:hypothetical protein